MKINLPLLILTSVFLFNGCATVGQSKPKAKEIDFSYQEEPAICFFPREQSKWDGYQVTNRNWGRLTEFQKIMFVYEGSKEIERKKSVVVEIRDANRALAALDFGIDKINQNDAGMMIPVIDFFYEILDEAKMITPRR